MYIVALEYEGKKPITYIADWAGDPGRTLVKDLAKRYKNASAAKRAITIARKYREFPDAKIILEDYCNAY